MRIYISGAITDTEDFRERFLKTEKELSCVAIRRLTPAGMLSAAGLGG